MSDARNLLHETTQAIEQRGHSTDDVQFVMSTAERWPNTDLQWCTWDEFAASADIAYDAGFGGNEVSEHLMVVGKDWWLERHEYDGSEWWEYKTLPTKTETHVSVLRIMEES